VGEQTRKRESCAIRGCTPRCATISYRLLPRSAGGSPAPSPRRSPAATATASSSSVRSMTERLVIGRLGSRGDGIADTAAGPVYVPYALADETVEVEPWPGHPDRRHPVKIEVAASERIPPISPP